MEDGGGTKLYRYPVYTAGIETKEYDSLTKEIFEEFYNSETELARADNGKDVNKDGNVDFLEEESFTFKGKEVKYTKITSTYKIKNAEEGSEELTDFTSEIECIYIYNQNTIYKLAATGTPKDLEKNQIDIYSFFTSFNFEKSKDNNHKEYTNKSNVIEKTISITYSDVYIDGNLIAFENKSDNTVIIPFVYEQTAYLPVAGFAEAFGHRKTVWDNENMVFEIGKPGKAENGTFTYPKDVPSEITVSFGGITLIFEGKEVNLSETEQLVLFNNIVYAPHDLLAKVFDKGAEWRQEEIVAPYGTWDYKYLFFGSGSAIEIDKQKFYDKNPPFYLDIEIL